MRLCEFLVPEILTRTIQIRPICKLIAVVNRFFIMEVSSYQRLAQFKSRTIQGSHYVKVILFKIRIILGSHYSRNLFTMKIITNILFEVLKKMHNVDYYGTKFYVPYYGQLTVVFILYRESLFFGPSH